MGNFDGLWEVRFFYTVTLDGRSLEHRLALDLNVTDPGTPGSNPDEYNLVGRDGTPANLVDWIEDFTTLFRPCYKAYMSLSRAELFYIPEGTYDALFHTVYDIGALGNNGGGTEFNSGQWTVTMRSQGGGGGRLQLMECINPSNQKSPTASTFGELVALANFVKGDASPVLARDNTFFLTTINYCAGQNEKLWRKRNRE